MVLKSLCIFGGCFDPIHYGHLILANYIREELDVEKFMFIPSFLPPHKEKAFSLFKHRFKMLKLALGKDSDFLVSDIESKRKEPSYSFLTINNLKSQYRLKSEQLYFLIGGDSLVDFHTWKEPHMILDSAQVMVLDRPGYCYDNVDKTILNKVKFLKTPLIEISSTNIRERIKADKSIEFFVPNQVVKYIMDNDLYVDWNKGKNIVVDEQ